MKNTLFIGKKTIELNSVDSTSNYLSNLIKTTNVMDGTVILAHNQTNGKGQRGNSWISDEKNNLTFSIFLKLNFVLIKNNFHISLLISNSLHELTSKYSKNTKIKWPNDIYVNDKKIGGILIENTIQNNSIKNTIIGIGFNVNQAIFPDNLNATSLLLETKNEFNLNELLSDFNSILEKNYFLFKNGNVVQIKRYYFKHLLGFQEEREFIITSENKKITGMITDVKDNGFLEITSQNKKLLFEIKEIEFIL